MKKLLGLFIALSLAVVPTIGCKKKTKPTKKKVTKRKGGPTTKRSAAKKEKKFVGVDVKGKKLYIGALNDMTGPAKGIGKFFALGKQVLAKQINAGDSGLLPKGWKIELVERDQRYSGKLALRMYKEIKNKVLFIGTSFGTPPTLPLRAHLTKDKVMAFPASLSSQMAKHKFTPPIGTSYKLEAMRALDWIVKKQKRKRRIKLAIVYQQDDYGKDALEGLEAAAKALKIKVVAKKPVAPASKALAGLVVSLKKSRANYVLLACLPNVTPKILGIAAKLRYRRVTWIGHTPSWVDAFFFLGKINRLFAKNFYWVNSLPFWGEKIPGMDKFLAAYKKHAPAKSRPSFYALISYIQGLVQVEAFNRMIKSKDFTRDGFIKALTSIKGWDANKMIQAIDLSKFPYVTGTKARILKANIKKKSWDVVAPYATPSTYK